MIGTRTVRFGLATLLAAGTLAWIGAPASAQGFGGGGGMPPEIAAKIKAWQKWRDAHKNISNLQTMLYQVREVDKDPATKLTKPQASKMLTILNVWQSKPSMTDDQAKDIQKQIGSMLTERQLKKLSTVQPPWGRQGGGGGGRPGGGGGFGGGGGRPGGAGGGRPGGFTFPDPPKGGYNPMNPDTLPFTQMRPQAKATQQEFKTALQSRK